MGIQRLRLVLWRASASLPILAAKCWDTSSAWRNEALLRISRRNGCWRRTCIAWRPWRGEERGGINLGLHEVTCLDRLVCVGDKGPDAGAAQATVTVAREEPAYWC
jgi:hypothetical protein